MKSTKLILKCLATVQIYISILPEQDRKHLFCWWYINSYTWFVDLALIFILWIKQVWMLKIFFISRRFFLNFSTEWINASLTQRMIHGSSVSFSQSSSIILLTLTGTFLITCVQFNIGSWVHCILHFCSMLIGLCQKNWISALPVGGQMWPYLVI